MALVPEKKDPDARVRSMERAQAVLNAYDWLLKAIPNNTETVMFANRMALRRLMKEWQGAWSEYQDFTELIVPFESMFVIYRKHYKARGVDTSKVPILIREANKMLPVRYVNEADLKKGNPNGGVNVGLLLGIGAVAVSALMVFRLPKRQLSGGFSGTEAQHAKNVRDRITSAQNFIFKATRSSDNPNRATTQIRHAIREIEFAKVEAAWLPTTSIDRVNLRQTEKLAEELFKRVTS